MYERAIVCYKKVISLDPTSAWAFCDKGRVLIKMGKNEAVDCFDWGKRLNPDDADSHNSQAYVLNKTN